MKIKKGDTIKCHDSDYAIKTMQDLLQNGIDTDFVYEKDGVQGLWLIVTDVNTPHICGTCKYHVWEPIDMGLVCVRSGSEHCSDWTENTDTCDKWEEKK